MMLKRMRDITDRPVIFIAVLHRSELKHPGHS